MIPYYARPTTIRQAIYRTQLRAEGAISKIECRLSNTDGGPGRDRLIENEGKILSILKSVQAEVGSVGGA